jgi:hypothetical protein
MVAASGHSINIVPYGKKGFKIFSSETSKQRCYRWSLGCQLQKMFSVTPSSVQNVHVSGYSNTLGPYDNFFKKSSPLEPAS